MTLRRSGAPDPDAASCFGHDALHTADADALERAALLLDEQGHPQAAAILRSARRLTWPNRAAQFGGRWEICIDPDLRPLRLFDVTQQIKRALNSTCSRDASYVDLEVRTPQPR